jgi:putative ABC transport system substrate-binding protein
VQLDAFDVRRVDDYEPAFTDAAQHRAGALLVLRNSFNQTNRNQIVALAAKAKLPTMYPLVEYVDAGGLMSYGVNTAELTRRSAVYVDKILKGAKPADLPVEQPTKFELIINLKAAKQIGVTIPPNVLARADRVIR